jgi:hypothetical protein
METSIKVTGDCTEIQTRHLPEYKLRLPTGNLPTSVKLRNLLSTIIITFAGNFNMYSDLCWHYSDNTDCFPKELA